MPSIPSPVPPFHLRDYQPADFPALCSIDRACFDSFIAWSPFAMRQALALPGSSCLVAVSLHAVIAFTVFSSLHQAGHILTLDVLPSWRRHGLGSALISSAESRLAALPVSSISLETDTSNAPAIAFWLRRGYCIRGTLQNYYRRGRHAYFMTRELASPRHPKET